MNPKIKKAVVWAVVGVASVGWGVTKRFLKREARYVAAVGAIAAVDAGAQAMSGDSLNAPARDSGSARPAAPDSATASQLPPAINKPKQAAQSAVAAANARTETVSTLPADTGKAPAVRQVEQVPTLSTSTDSAAGSTSVKSAGAAFEREAYLYDRGGRRDPFVSLMANGELRPLISDLRLVAVAYDAAGGRNSVAVVHDVSGKEKVQYRLRIGQGVGRMRVASISPKSVAFTIEEFGYSRQETLALGDSNKERKQ